MWVLSTCGFVTTYKKGILEIPLIEISFVNKCINDSYCTAVSTSNTRNCCIIILFTSRSCTATHTKTLA